NIEVKLGKTHKVYKVNINADFAKITKKPETKAITSEIVDELLWRPDDTAFWEATFPQAGYIFEGFVLLNLTDITLEHSVSAMKNELLQSKFYHGKLFYKIEHILKILFGDPHLKGGIAYYDEKNQTFEAAKLEVTQSYLLKHAAQSECKSVFCAGAFSTLIESHKPYIISDVERYAKGTNYNLLSKNLLEDHIKSAIFIPVVSNQKLLAIIEVASAEKNLLNALNYDKLNLILPYLSAAVERNINEFKNDIKAIIQSQFTSLHPSIAWRFEMEALRKLKHEINGDSYSTSDILFEYVYPLYGQSDIVGSSSVRNNATRLDLHHQLEEIHHIFKSVNDVEEVSFYDFVIEKSDTYLKQLEQSMDTTLEAEIANFIKTQVNPVISFLGNNTENLRAQVDQYNNRLDEKSGICYSTRRNYDDSVQMINRVLVNTIDTLQKKAQEFFPHMFDRYKTDGVEHNMYIGQSISRSKKFNMLHLYNLRLWQLQSICLMEQAVKKLAPRLPMPLDVASMVLVFSSSLSIRFRTDEKRFDVDGSYNARYEVIKKRIDKAVIEGSEERLTQKEKLSIVYSGKKEEQEYLRYIKYLQQKGFLKDNLEQVKLKEEPGVSGMKALRVGINYESKPVEQPFTYADLTKELLE
ncbi:MAG: GAF domain-containing protein, partial [Flavobacteriaceae bacterium]|nr:GAF domain-containing protein [Flavobacteriaceae bacterium]